MRRASFLLFLALFFAAACAEVLGIRPPARRLFEHRAHVIEGIHCNTCHDGMEGAGESGPLHLPSTATCVSCHAEPHDTRDCRGCHGQSFAREGAILAREHLRFDHTTHLPRVKGDCVRCHLDIQQDSAILRPRMAICFGCHQDDMQKGPEGCDACHVNLRSEGSMPSDHLAHEPGFDKTHGRLAATEPEACSTCHTQKFCTSCHGGRAAPLTPERLNFGDPMGMGVHRAGFFARHSEEARGDPGLCTTCHAPNACADCHASRGVGAGGRLSRDPHPSGWLGLKGHRNDHGQAAWRDPALCASCHGGAGEQLCVNCHKVGAPGGNPHAPGWSSPKRPRLDAPCRACHEAG